MRQFNLRAAYEEQGPYWFRLGSSKVIWQFSPFQMLILLAALTVLLIQMHQGKRVKKCSVDSKCFIEASRSAIVRWIHCVQRFIFFTVFFFLFLSCRCPQVHPVCILRNCFSSPSTCRYGATLTSTGHLKTLRVQMQRFCKLRYVYSVNHIMVYNYKLHNNDDNYYH